MPSEISAPHHRHTKPPNPPEWKLQPQAVSQSNRYTPHPPTTACNPLPLLTRNTSPYIHFTTTLRIFFAVAISTP
ncbi:hypothetical protein K458DRAFT_413886 [Lentithecium fluviatile CBS 122367]|uniref:Uncharacterized protein n=1 Tax=Lentithecium fluviatile CBS 122367 TaxID=1168545 RepID=A0A6G1JGE6_9PLEO|nr:hypothetical protein K458DRAFT_413886 [Lentithecium fluviatile CBS 122367]